MNARHTFQHLGPEQVQPWDTHDGEHVEEGSLGFIVGVDASRNRSGGAKAHLVGILTEGDPTDHGIAEVHVWAYGSLLRDLPERPWLRKHNPPELEMSLPRQLWWQRKRLPPELRAFGCQILLTTDAGSVCGFEPSVAMSRDMLSYEKGEAERFGYSLARLRLWALKHVQARSLKKARGAIFLTKHAAKTIQAHTGELHHVRIIPHGVGQAFRNGSHDNEWTGRKNQEISCLYVSVVNEYKHQWHVVEGVAELRHRGHNVNLLLAGGGSGKPQSRLKAAITKCDPGKQFVKELGFVPHEDIPELLRRADVFIFASSCENMPNMLIEAMANGLPIACSNRGPMPEVLGDGGVFFDPESPASISAAVEAIVVDRPLRARLAARAEELSRQYSWERCAAETWDFLVANIGEGGG